MGLQAGQQAHLRREVFANMTQGPHGDFENTQGLFQQEAPVTSQALPSTTQQRLCLGGRPPLTDGNATDTHCRRNEAGPS